MDMNPIGRIKFVQIQQSSLKIGKRPTSFYDPTPLLIVDRLIITAEGAIGVTAEGTQFIDVHHAQHPNSRQTDGKNGLSIGFTSHYQEMRKKFGDHLKDGCAGENILVEIDRQITLNDLGKQLAIQNQKDGTLIYFTGLQVAVPCIEFSQYVANSGMPLPADQLKSTLQFLDHGMRGFYLTLADQQPQASLQAGDRVFSVEPILHMEPRYSSLE